MDNKKSFIDYFKNLAFPSIKDVPMNQIVHLFYKGITKGFITTRASSISYSFFLAFFPAIIFIFTLIPYIPIPNFQSKLLGIIQDVTPTDAYAVIRSTIEDIINRPHGGLLSLGFILTLYFATNGTNSIIKAFNDTYHTIETRKIVRQYGISMMLVLIFSSIVIVAIILLTLGTTFLHMLVINHILKRHIIYIILEFLRWIIVVLMFFFGISFLYYYAPSKHVRFQFFSPGAFLATLLYIATSLGFNYYISHFSRYNKVYGSIGTLMVIMLWIYFNSFILLLGFELNVSIMNAVKKKKS